MAMWAEWKITTCEECETKQTEAREAKENVWYVIQFKAIVEHKQGTIRESGVISQSANVPKWVRMVKCAQGDTAGSSVKYIGAVKLE